MARPEEGHHEKSGQELDAQHHAGAEEIEQPSPAHPPLQAEEVEGHPGYGYDQVGVNQVGQGKAGKGKGQGHQRGGPAGNPDLPYVNIEEDRGQQVVQPEHQVVADVQGQQVGKVIDGVEDAGLAVGEKGKAGVDIVAPEGAGEGMEGVVEKGPAGIVVDLEVTPERDAAHEYQVAKEDQDHHHQDDQGKVPPHLAFKPLPPCRLAFHPLPSFGAIP